MSKLSDIFHSKAAILSILLIIGFLAVPVSLAATRGDSSPDVLFQDRTDTHMDFFNSLYDTIPEDPYRDRGVIYPALTYLFYDAMKDCIPLVYTLEKGDGIAMSQIAKMEVLYFILLGSALLVFGLRALGGKRSFLLPMTLLLSAPFIYLLERGNMLLITVAFTCIFLAYHDHPRPVVRELAYISLAIAAATKIYPALFGLVLLREKDWKGALHCVIWGALLFVLPFFKWGGLEDIRVMVYNILHNGNSGSRTGFGEKLNFSNTFRMLAAYTGREEFGVLARYSSILCAVLLGPAMLFSREKWRTVLAVAVFCTAFPDFSYIYSAVLLFPAVMLFAEAERKKSDWVYLPLLAVLLVPWMVDLSAVLPGLAAADAEAIFVLSSGSVFGSFALMALAVCLFISAVSDLIRGPADRRAA